MLDKHKKSLRRHIEDSVEDNKQVSKKYTIISGELIISMKKNEAR